MMLTFLFGLAAFTSFVAAKSFMGPFDVIVKEPVDCENLGTKEVFYNETIIRKTGKRTFTMTTKVFLAVDLSDDIQIIVNFAVWGNGGWRPNFLTLQDKACSMFREKAPELFKQALEGVNLPVECPIPKGAYMWENIDPTPNIDIAQLPYNKYKIYIDYYSSESVLLGCHGFIVNIVAKEKKKG